MLFGGTLVAVAVLLAIIGVLAYGVGAYNSLVQVSNNIQKAWKNIDVLLLQRHDELPKLIDACRAYMKHERDILERLTTLRVGYDGARTIDDKAGIENEINRNLARLNVSVESYPDLKASQVFLQVQGRVSALESSIADRRELFNDSVNIYNIQIARFPESLLARVLGYRPHTFLEVPEEKKRDVKMDFDAGTSSRPA
jgi:LemA protein